MEAESPAETSFHEISKVLGRKTDKDGIDWIRVRWKKHPSKKYNSWVQASDIKRTFATQVSPASSSDEEARIGVHDESVNVPVPIEVSSGSEYLDETVIPSKPTRPASPVAVPAKIEPAPERDEENPLQADQGWLSHRHPLGNPRSVRHYRHRPSN